MWVYLDRSYLERPRGMSVVMLPYNRSTMEFTSTRETSFQIAAASRENRNWKGAVSSRLYTVRSQQILMSQNDFHLHFPHNFNSSSRKVTRTGEFTFNRMVTPLQIPFLQGIIILQQKGEESRRENCKSNLKPRDLKGLITFLSSQGFSLFGLSFPSDMCIIRCHISLPGLDVKQQTVLVAFGVHDNLQVRFLQCLVAQELLTLYSNKSLSSE